MRIQRSLGILVLSLAGITLASAQQSGGGGGRPGGNTGGGTTGGGRTTTPSTTTVPQQRRDTIERRIVFISGNVIMQDGSPVPEPVVIERSCGSTTRKEATTDSKGYFSFQIGNRTVGMFQDASVSGDPMLGRSDPFGMQGASNDSVEGVSRYQLIGCELRASLAGYRSSTLHMDNIQYLSQNNIGTIVLAKMGSVPGSTVSVSMLAAPKDARKEFEKGHEALKKEKFEDARKHLAKSLEMYPKMAPAQYDLGFIEQVGKNKDAARLHYNQALEIDPNYVQPMVQLATLSAGEQNWAETAKLTEKAVQLDPLDFPIAFFYNAVANFNLGKVDVAEKSARKALQLDGGHSIPKLPLLMGKILEAKHDYAGAAEQIRTYLKISPDATDAAAARENLAQLEKSAVQNPAPQ